MHHITILLADAPKFKDFIIHWGAVGIFIWFLTINNFNPVPSEISLLLIGYLAAHHYFDPVLAGIATVAGCVAVDVAYYYLARTGSGFVKKKMHKSKSGFWNSYKEKLKNHMPKTLIVLCFIPRMRMFGPIIVGGMKMSFKKFLLYDSIGVVLFTAVYLSIGFVFHESLSSMSSKIEGAENFIFLGALVLVAVVIFVVARMGSKKKKKKA